MTYSTLLTVASTVSHTLYSDVHFPSWFQYKCVAISQVKEQKEQKEKEKQSGGLPAGENEEEKKWKEQNEFSKKLKRKPAHDFALYCKTALD